MADKPHRILVLGATSAIAQAYARRRAPEGAAFVLVGRKPERLVAIADDLKARGAASAETVDADLSQTDDIDAATRDWKARFGDFNEVLLAYGLLGDQTTAETDLALAQNLLETNFTSAALWILALLRDKAPATRMDMVIIGSVAGDRGRASNFIYGAAKGGLDRFLEGLTQKYDGSPVRIITIKPGFVDTPMTAGLSKGGALWAAPEQVASDIHRAVVKGRRVVYTPWFWWPIMFIIRHLPWFVFKRLKV